MFHQNLNPILIFAESHEDPITGAILARLSSKLKSLGYKFFFDEIPQTTLGERIKELEKLEQAYLELNKKFTEYGLDINDRLALNKFIMLQLKAKDLTDPKIIDLLIPALLNDVSPIITRHSANLTFKKFLNCLLKDQINYKGIDLEMKQTVSLETRDKNMVNAYLDAKISVFGRIGLAHVEGVQREILTKISKEQASTKFCFFNIFSNPPLPYTDNLENRVRNGDVAFPLGIISIDAINNHEDQIVEIVFQEILKRQDTPVEPKEAEHKNHSPAPSALLPLLIPSETPAGAAWSHLPSAQPLAATPSPQRYDAHSLSGNPYGHFLQQAKQRPFQPTSTASEPQQKALVEKEPAKKASKCYCVLL